MVIRLVLELRDANIAKLHYRPEDQFLHGKIRAVGEHRAPSRDFRVDECSAQFVRQMDDPEIVTARSYFTPQTKRCGGFTVSVIRSSAFPK